jgi:anti-sigma B factor antagonist
VERAAKAQERSHTLFHAVHARRRRYLHRLRRPVTRRRLRFFPVVGASEAYLKVETEERPGAYVVRLCGEVDLATITLLRGALDGQIQSHQKVILDCRRLTYIDSTGLNLLADLYKHGRRFVFVAPTPAIQQILGIAGLDLLMPVAPSVEDALKTMAGEAARQRPSGA